MAEKVGGIYYDVTLETGQMVEGQRKVEKELGKTTDTLDKFGSKLTQVAAAIGAYSSALYLIEKSDAFTKMNAQLKLATDSTRELAIAQADVKRIAQEAQADIGSVASLYAKVTSSTKELGLAQSTVASITRTVSLALKVSGATAAESGAAIMQLGQAFASGTLRGDEFNSVNEAAPRLMKALADGIGVPVGQLRAMAEAGKLTSEVLANALPKALKDLESEAKQIQTISGAFQELKNEVMLFVGEQTTTSGAVKVVAGSISALTNNLGLLAGVMATVAAVKFAVWLEAIVTQSLATVAANQAARMSTLAAAEAQVVATAATSALSAARVVELRSSVLSSQGNVALAVTTNGLIPAQARAAVAAEAHAVALGALTVAQRAASVSGAAAAGVLSLLGGPIGAIVTVLGLGATAWMMWGKSAEDSSKQASDAIEASGREILSSLEKQNAKLRERLALSKAGNVDAAKSGSKDAEKLAATLTEINTLKAKGAELTGADRIQLVELEGRYRDISSALAENKRLTGEISDAGQKSKASEWLVKYATDVERVNIEVAKAKKELGDAFTPELEKRIREKIIPAKKPKKSADEKFDDAGYLAGLQKNAVDTWDAITVAETEAMRKHDKLMKQGKLSFSEYEQGKLAIAEGAHIDRSAIMEREFNEAVKLGEKRAAELERLAQTTAETNIAAATNELQKIDLARQENIRRANEAVNAGVITFAQGEADKARFAVDAQQAIRDQVLSVNPVAKLSQEYEQKLSIVRFYEQQMAQAGVDATIFADTKRAELATQFQVQRQALAESEFAMQSQGNKAVIDGLNSLTSTATSSISGLITGTMSAQDAMKGLANVVLNSAVGALVEVGVQYIKNAIIGQTTAAAVATAQTAAIATTTTAQIAATAAVTTTSVAAAGTVAAAAAPAAGLMSIATLGQAALIGGAAIIGTMAIAKSFGGGRQYGGPVSAGSMYRVNETGAPEMFTASSGKQYMMPSKSGQVTAADKIGGGDVQWSVIINNAPQGTTSSVDQSTRTVTVAVAEVANQIRSNSGPVWSALRGSTTTQSRL